jgi:cell division protein FtsW
MQKSEHSPDWWLLFAAVAMLCVGIFIVFDASYARAALASATGNDAFFYLKRQLLWGVLSIMALLLGMRIRYWRLRAWWLPILVMATVLVTVVLVPGIGIEVNGSRRWLGYGPLRLQPSELAKLALVIYIASYASVRKTRLRNFFYGLAPILAVMGLIGVLVAKEDLGTAVSTMLTGLIMTYVGGARKRHLGILCLLCAVAFSAFVFHKEYRKQRVVAFMSPWDYYNGAGYQPAHSLVALGSGGLTGQGIARGRQKYLYLPAEHTDYIFATIGEEMGLIGSLLLLVGFAFLIGRGLSIAHRTKDRFGSLLAVGLTSMMAVQAIMNIAVVTSSVPATGVPLPFISYGGSSLIFTMLAVGLILNVSQYPEAAETGRTRSAPDVPEREQRTRVSATRLARPRRRSAGA